MEVLICGLGLVLLLVMLGAMNAAVRSFNVRPSQNEVVQMTWHQRENLERSSIGGSFWRFVAKLEFLLLLGAALWILLLLNA